MSQNTTDFGLATLLGGRTTLLDTATPLEDHITVHGDPARFAAFTHIPQLRGATTAIDAWDGAPRTARAWFPPGTTAGAPPSLYAAPEQLRALYDAGFTIVLEDVERFVPALRPLCRRLEEDLDVAPGRINVEIFCALKGGHGPAHFDSGFTFNCQVEGTKTWRLTANEWLRFPPAGIGMFLGHPVPPDLEGLLTAPIPAVPEMSQTFVAEPGSVVFMPPGVIHETRMETASFAVAFAIEATDCVADIAAARIRAQLLAVPDLRAPRLGAQARTLRRETSLVAEALRRIADSLDATGLPWCHELDRVRIRPGLSAEVCSETTITLRGASAVRTLTFAPAVVAILGWASKRDVFSLRDIARELLEIDLALAGACMRQLVHTGLLEMA